MEFTGERYVPGTPGLEELYIEHMSRYVVASDLADGKCVLDLGCGCGYGAYYLAMCGADMVVGIDNSVDAIQFGRTRYKHADLHFAVMDAHELALKGRFDLVTCFEVIEHLDNAPQLLCQVSDILSDNGIFMVSTPNKRTYRAGGENGTNPFHVTEYDIDEFGQMLRAVFPHIHVFGQHWIEGIAVSPHPKETSDTVLPCSKLPEEDGVLHLNLTKGEPQYFIAACGKEDIVESACLNICPVVLHSLQTRYDGLKQSMNKLMQEFDERGKWAQALDRDNRKKDGTISGLLSEIRTLRDGFDKRGEDIRVLNEEREQSKNLIRRLSEENKRLKNLFGVVA